MNAPPLLMKLKIYNEEHNIDLWLPLFLAWIILLALMIALSPLAILLIILLWGSGWSKFIARLPVYLYRLLRDLKDSRVDVRKKDENVLIYFK